MTSSASQQQLRMLMKQQLASQQSGNEGNAKDKVKMLKAMKEQQKQVAVAPSVPKGVGKSISSVPTMSSSMSAPAVSSGAVPAGFFDEEPTPMPAQIAAKANHALSSTTTSKASNEPKITKNTSVPLGFFDNVEEDFQAHGINYQQFQQKQEEVIQEEVSTFMNEIEGLTKEMEEFEEQQEQQEKLLQEEEETILQMSYITKYAALLKQSEKFVNKASASSSNVVQSGVDIEKMLKEVEEIQSISKVADSSDANINTGVDDSINQNSKQSSTTTTGTVDRVQSMMKQKLMNKFANISAISSKRKELESIMTTKSVHVEPDAKRAKVEEQSGDEEEDDDDEEEEDDEEDELEEYSPLDYMNFSGRY